MVAVLANIFRNRLVGLCILGCKGRETIDIAIVHTEGGGSKDSVMNLLIRGPLLARFSGLEAVFPLWQKPTQSLALEMIDSGFKAIVTCVDPKQLPVSFAGRPFDRNFLRDLPSSADPCGEKGEFHTFVFDGPIFRSPIEVQVGETVERDGFIFTDILPA